MALKRFETRLVPGGKPPYDTWTFVVVPPAIAEAWGKGRVPVRGTLAGVAFRGTAARGEGVVRIPVPEELRERAGVARGDTVEVALERDPEPRPLELPAELSDVLAQDPVLPRLFDALPPSMRRAWAQHVAEAKRPETRLRRAAQAPDGIRARRYPG